MNSKLLPCSTCPWRKNRDATTIPRYSHEMACDLMNTVGEEDGFRPVMACHGSPVDNEQPCMGYLAQAGWSNLNVRFLNLRGMMPHPDVVADACAAAGVELEPDYETVLNKMGESVGEF